jgi:osmotically-inducible protein OsmY
MQPGSDSNSHQESSMKTDAHIKADVTDELAWDPAVNATGIGVAVKDGVVTLTGHLDSYAEKHAVERAVKRVAGVRGIALELDVKLAAEHKRSDSDIAQAAATALQLNSLVPDEKIQVLVENGRVTLTGEVDWSYQLASAEQCVRPLAGVRGLSNRITIKSRASSKDVGAQITAALTRQAAREAKHITVEVEGSVVTLWGKVHSLAEREAAVGAAFSARGVSRVVDKLEVGA